MCIRDRQYPLENKLLTGTEIKDREKIIKESVRLCERQTDFMITEELLKKKQAATVVFA